MKTVDTARILINNKNMSAYLQRSIDINMNTNTFQRKFTCNIELHCMRFIICFWSLFCCFKSINVGTLDTAVAVLRGMQKNTRLHYLPANLCFRETEKCSSANRSNGVSLSTDYK